MLHIVAIIWTVGIDHTTHLVCALDFTVAIGHLKDCVYPLLTHYSFRIQLLRTCHCLTLIVQQPSRILAVAAVIDLPHILDAVDLIDLLAVEVHT